VLPILPGIPDNWESFGIMLGEDQRSDNPDVRESAQRCIDVLLDYINAKLRDQVVV
jgi:hypothetical protein